MKIYNKLIRDKIPEIIKNDGNVCEIKVLNDEEYLKELNKKLQEELNEYYESGDIEELADLTEIIYAIAKHKVESINSFEKIRLEKRKQRGGFDDKLFLIGVKNPSEAKEDKLDFGMVWKDINKILHTGYIVYTISQHKPNEIIEISDNGILVKTNMKPELVEKEWIKAAWDTLVENGKLAAQDIPGVGRYRSSFILALLAKLRYVRMEEEPIALYLKNR